MQPQVALPAITLPQRRSDVLPRQRLLNILDSLSTYRLILVIAPAGYGKTSLLIDYAHHLNKPVCWYSVERFDTDLKRFLAHWIAAISMRFPGFGRFSQAALKSSEEDLLMDDFITHHINELYRRAQEPFIIILDDDDGITQNDDIAAFINQFIQRAPASCRVLLASREAPDLAALALLKARRQIATLTWEDLAFTAEEIQTLWTRNFQQPISFEHAVHLAQTTEGWIVGLLLAEHAGHVENLPSTIQIRHSSDADVYTYFAREVLGRQPEHVRVFLLRSSLLGDFNASLCDQVFGTSLAVSDMNWQELIGFVTDNNLFVMPASQDGWVRYHLLFQDFLFQEMKRTRPAETRQILQQLVQVYEVQGEWEKAYRITKEISDVKMTIGFLSRIGIALIRSGKFSLLRQWLAELPSGVVENQPDLLSLKGAAEIMGKDIAAGIITLTKAEAIYRTEENYIGLARCLTRLAIGHHFQGDYQATLMDANTAITLITQNQPDQAVHAEALRAKGLSLTWMGKPAEAIQYFQQALMEYQELMDEESLPNVYLEMGAAFRFTGNFEQALDAYSQALSCCHSADNPYQTANVLNNLGVLHFHYGNYVQSSATLNEGLQLAQSSGYLRAEALILCSIGDLYGVLGAGNEARVAYQQALDIAHRANFRFLTLYSRLGLARESLICGDIHQASKWLQLERVTQEASSTAYERGLVDYVAGLLSLHEGQWPAAIRQLSRSLEHFQHEQRYCEKIRAGFVLAIAYHHAGEIENCREQLVSVLDNTEQFHCPNCLVIAAQEGFDILQLYQTDPLMGHKLFQAQQRIRDFQRTLPSVRRAIRRQQPVVAFAPPLIQVRGLGDAQVAVAGRAISMSEWHIHRARDLFFLLLAYPQGLSRAAVIDNLWPNAAPMKIANALKECRHRLRKALGDEVVFFGENSYQINPALDYECDVERFQGILKTARGVVEPERKYALFRQALADYKGDYLPDTDGRWVIPERQRLQLQYIDVSLEVAEYDFLQRNFTDCLERSWAILKLDPGHEAAHRLIMRVHAAQGNRSAITRQYQQCRQALRTQYETHPSLETESLYRELLS
jgi:ATP/maltotriose-dependent transcriptional regulator MalT/DNA-binding SARP family transcriptional activator